MHGRGPSNTLASPGINSVFGCDTTIKATGVEAAAPTFGGIQPKPAPRDDAHRYSNTFKSSAFAQPESNGQGRPVTAQTSQVTSGPAPGARTAYDPHAVTFAQERTDQAQVQRRTAAANYGQLQGKQVAARDAKREINTFYGERDAVWREKVRQNTNKQLTEQIQKEMADARREQREHYQRQQQEYKQVLAYQKTSEVATSQQQQYDERKQDIHANGLQFECYTRDQLIAQEKTATTQFQKAQAAKDEMRRQQETQVDKQVPPGFMDARQQEALKAQANLEFAQKKAQVGSEMRQGYQEHHGKKMGEQRERLAQIQREQEDLARVKRDMEAERTRKKQEKHQARSSMTSHLNSIEKAKRDQWNAEKKSTENHAKTVELLQEQARAQQEQEAFASAQKSGYKSQLDVLKGERRQTESVHKDLEGRAGKLAGGFQFECYT